MTQHNLRVEVFVCGVNESMHDFIMAIKYIDGS